MNSTIARGYQPKKALPALANRYAFFWEKGTHMSKHDQHTFQLKETSLFAYGLTRVYAGFALINKVTEAMKQHKVSDR